MYPNAFGEIAGAEWAQLQNRYPECEPELFQLMPDHIHGIINVAGPRFANDAIALGKIIGGYKSIVLHKCLTIAKEQDVFLGKLWQRGFYDTIIKSHRAYENIVQYIIENPMNYRRGDPCGRPS